MTDRSCSVAVIGGGVLGMTLALRLCEQGHDVTLFDGATTPGGLTSPQEIGGYTWDRFYHVILPGDSTLLALLDEIGLGDKLRWATTRTGFYANGRMHSISNTPEFLRFPLLSLLDKARLALTIWAATRITDARKLEAIPVVQWLRRWSGRRAVDRMWLPLLRAKLGDNYRITSAAFVWAYLVRLYGARQSGSKKERLGYVDGGYHAILGALRARLSKAGVEIRCGQAIAEIREDRDGVRVRAEGNGVYVFDRAVLTVPCGQVQALCPQLEPGERERLARVVYQGIICPSVLLRQPLDGFYVTNIADGTIPFTAIVEMSALTGTERFGGATLVYLPRYLAQDDPCWNRPDSGILDEFLAALRRLYPALTANDVIAARVSRAREVQALATMRYTDRALPATRTSLRRVFVANSAQIVNGTLNVNETVTLANAKARELGALMAAGATTRAGVAPEPRSAHVA